MQAYELLDWIDDVFTFKQFHLTTPIAKIGHVLIMGMVSWIPIGVLKIIGSMWKLWDKIPTSCTNSKSDVYWFAGCHTKSSLLRHQDGFNSLRPKQNGRNFADETSDAFCWMKSFVLSPKYQWIFVIFGILYDTFGVKAFNSLRPSDAYMRR